MLPVVGTLVTVMALSEVSSNKTEWLPALREDYITYIPAHESGSEIPIIPDWLTHCRAVWGRCRAGRGRGHWSAEVGRNVLVTWQIIQIFGI